MTEIEESSIIRYVLDKSGVSDAYFDELPDGYAMPAVYFLPPKIKSSRETLTTYRLRHAWEIKFYHQGNRQAFKMASDVQNALESGRLLIPITDEQGKATDESLRLRKTKIKNSKKEKGAVRLKLKWDSHYKFADQEAEKMMLHKTTFNNKVSVKNAD